MRKRIVSRKLKPKVITKNNVPIIKSGTINKPTFKKPSITKHNWNGETINNLIVIGYYTKGTPYVDEANRLISSLNKFNINHDIVGVSNLGDWQSNTRYKAKFILDMLNKHKDYNLLYVDVDAIFHTYPTLFKNYDCDIAVRWQDFRWKKNECLSGTIYLANNDINRELCNLWIAENSKTSTERRNLEQWNLGVIINKLESQGKLRSKNLPAEYTFIFDSMRSIYPNANPVIEHFQASRKYKRRL